MPSSSGLVGELHLQVLGGAAQDFAREFLVVLDVLLALAPLDAVERRLRDEDVAALDQLLHVAEEERQQQRADVRAVHVGVGHDDDLAVAQLGGVEIVLADAGADGRDHGADFFVAQHLVVAGLLDVEDFALAAAESPDSGGRVRSWRCRRPIRPPPGTVRSAPDRSPGNRPAFPGRPPESSAPLRRVRSRALRAASRARAASIALETIFLITDGFLSKNSPSFSLMNCDHVALDVGIELALGLPFELRLRQLHADHRGQAFAHIVAA